MTDISLGSLGIDAQTTVADFSRAVMGSNPDWLKGDQLTCFRLILKTMMMAIIRIRITKSMMPSHSL